MILNIIYIHLLIITILIHYTESFFISCFVSKPLILGIVSYSLSNVEIQPSMETAEMLTTRQKVIRGTNNFLTNPVLETVRKIDQMDFDDSTTNKEVLLVPIVRIDTDFNTIKSLFEEMKSPSISSSNILQNLNKVLEILNKPDYQKSNFKALFNRYSDNIFYTNPDQANIYLAGGTPPNSRQTEQYLLRNQVLNSVEFIRGDAESMIDDIKMKNSKSSSGNIDWEQIIIDTISDLEEGENALREYLKLADPKDVELATKIVQSGAK